MTVDHRMMTRIFIALLTSTHSLNLCSKVTEQSRGHQDILSSAGRIADTPMYLMQLARVGLVGIFLIGFLAIEVDGGRR